MMLVFSTILLALFFYYGLSLVQWLAVFGKKQGMPALLHHPFVSVLVAARNEEANITSCIQALLEQDYPPEKIQFLIGDDGSNDGTADLVRLFEAQHHAVKLYAIAPSNSHLKGKAHVLAELFKKADGEVVFITDADIVVGKSWIRGMLSAMQYHSADAVSGTTFVKNSNGFHLFQHLEWIEALGLLYTADQYGIPVTAVGNNMAIRKEAYLGVGGYESIPFSVTEDLDLFLALKKKNYTHRQCLNQEVLAWTNPVESFMDLLRQRKRWMKGVERTPLICRLYMFLHAMMGLVIGFLFYYDVAWAVSLSLLSFFSHCITIKLITRATEISFKKNWLVYILFIDWYRFFFTTCLILYYIMPTGIEWKKRRYA